MQQPFEHFTENPSGIAANKERTFEILEEGGAQYPLTLSLLAPLAPVQTLTPRLNWRDVVKLPEEAKKLHWLASHTIDFDRILFQLFSCLSVCMGKCSSATCGSMSCGQQMSFFWKDRELTRPYRISASDYAQRAFKKINEKIDNSAIFPLDGDQYPADFLVHVAEIFKFQFRIFVHAYLSHYDDMKALNLDLVFNTAFIHFMNFGVEFDLFIYRELSSSPVRRLLKNLCADVAIRYFEKTNPELIHELSTPEQKLSENSEDQHLVSKFKSRDAKVTIASDFVVSYYLRLQRHLESFQRAHLKYRSKPTDIDDFELGSYIGKGGFGAVRICRYKNDSDRIVYVMKSIYKPRVVERGNVHRVRRERNIMDEMRNPWLVKLDRTFQDANFFYFIMEFCQGGDLMRWLIEKETFSEPYALFYIAEIILAVETMHNAGYIHRDVKPDNVMLTSTGHVKLADFGLAIKTNGENVASEAHHRYMLSPAGTIQYIAPEILSGQNYTCSVDLWSVGIILYEMLYGRVPFSEDRCSTQQAKIMNWARCLTFPRTPQISDAAINLIQSLICGPEQRYNIHQIKAHSFFKAINWDSLPTMQSPFESEMRFKGPDDIKFFEDVQCIDEQGRRAVEFDEANRQHLFFKGFTQNSRSPRVRDDGFRPN